MFFLPLYFRIIIAGIIRLSNGYNEFQRCTDPLPKFDTYRSKNGIKIFKDFCTDFYEYGCRNWQYNNPNPPPGYVTWSTYKQVQHDIFYRVHELLEGKKYHNMPFVKLAKQYHRSCMNEETIENEGLKSIKLMLKATGEWPILDSRQWHSKSYTWQKTYETYNKLYGFSNIFRIVYEKDELDESRCVFLISQSLGNKEQLLKDKCPYVTVDAITKVVHAFAADETKNLTIKTLDLNVNEIISFERHLKKIIDQVKTTEVTRMTIEELQHFYHSFTQTGKAALKINWLDIIRSSFEDIKLIINASQPVLVNKEFFRKTAVLLDVTRPHIIVNYIQWNMVCRLMKYLNKQIRNIECNSNCNVSQQETRWLTCVQDKWVQDISSYLYVKIYISADILKAVSKMADEIKAELKERISLSSWMSNDMKKYLMNKLDKVLLYIGYPKWYDNDTIFIERYKGLEFGNNYFDNLLKIAEHQRKKLYATVMDSNLNMYNWRIHPIAAVAVYVTWENKIVIPAALIHDPFFMPNRPAALNYGALGFILGHEFAHTLDLSKNKTWECLIDHYNNITREQGITDESGKPISHGKVALSENIPDIIGIEAAFAAFQKNRANNDGQRWNLWFMDLNATDEQLFFLSFANVMCTLTNVKDVTIGNFSGQSLENIRIISSVSNMKSFSEAFKCPIGSPMNPESRCKIWR